MGAKGHGYSGNGIRVLDTETTGLNPRRDEVLSLSILDGDGCVLFDRRFGTTRCTRWDAAQSVHGIAPGDVRGHDPLASHAAHIAEILEGASVIVGYNLAFDLAFLKHAGIAVPAGIPRFDVMREFARLHGLRGGGRSQRRWATLADCAAHYGHAFAAHSSLEDARATLACFEGVCQDAGLS